MVMRIYDWNSITLVPGAAKFSGFKHFESGVNP